MHFFGVVHSLHGQLGLRHEMVSFDVVPPTTDSLQIVPPQIIEQMSLSISKRSTPQALYSVGHDLVENMVTPLARSLLDDARFLQQV